MAKKSKKKLTPNQAEFERLLRNARQRFNRYLRKGYKSQYNAKDVFSSFTDIPKAARAQFNKLGFAQFTATSSAGVESNIIISLNKAPLANINEADLAFSNFVEANARWVTDKKKHAGMEYILDNLREERNHLQNRYGKNEGDTVFAYMLNEIGVAAGTLTSQEANDVNAAGRWLGNFYEHREAGVEEMMKLNEAFGDVQA